MKSRKGSLEYWPHRRAKKQMPRLRTWPQVAEQGFLGSVGVKAGMTHVAMIDDSESPSKGSEISRAVTVIEMPKVYIYGLRFYRKMQPNNYTEPVAESYEQNLAKKVGIINIKKSRDLSELKGRIADYSNVTALAFTDQSNLGFGNKRTMRFEIGIGGKDVSEKSAFAEKWLGKELKAADVVKLGDYIDVISISKGKGWAGVIKRFKVSRQVRKATGKIRHVGVLGPWHPAKVMYTVPHSGHMGHNYRLEMNKRVLKMGTEKEASQINVHGGFVNYGVVRNDFIMLDGSIPGPSKRLIRFRKALRPGAKPKEPNLTYISVASKQGA